MTDNKDDTGEGPFRPGEAPRRPYATIDLKATEIGRQKGQAGAQGGSPEAKGPKAAALPPPSGPEAPGAWLWPSLGAWARALAGGVAAAWTWALRLVRGDTFLSHMAAGIVGAALTIAVTSLLGLLPARQARVETDAARRLAAVERTLAQQSANVPADAGARLSAVDARLASLEERAKGIAALDSAQTKLAADAKALEARIAGPEVAERIAKLETALAALSAEDKAGGGPLADRLAAKLADVEKLSGEASAAKSASVRVERDLAALKTEAAGLGQSLEALKGAVEARLKDVAKAGEMAPVLAKLAALERDLNAVLKTEGDRIAGSQRVLLTLEIANLKRALDRGDSFARELDAVRKASGGTVDLTALDHSSLTGVPTLGTLTLELKRVANAALDAESERPDASVLDRLVAGARSIVRTRKARYDPDDLSVEATLGRMESALKDGNIGEVLAQGKRLPPKGALAAEDWLRKLEARYAADRAVADIEARLKASLAEQRLPQPVPEPEPKR